MKEYHRVKSFLIIYCEESDMNIERHTGTLQGPVPINALGAQETLFSRLSHLVPQGSAALEFRFDEYVMVDDAANDEPPRPASRA